MSKKKKGSNMCWVPPTCNSDVGLDVLHIIPVYACKNTPQRSIIGPILQTEKLKSRKLKFIKSHPESIWLRVGSIVWSKGSESF